MRHRWSRWSNLISRFKATCLAVLERVRKTGQPILVTKRGAAVAQIQPPPPPESLRRDLLHGRLGRRPSFRADGEVCRPPMDLADASLIVAAESLGTRKIFTIDFRDFSVYRIRHGRGQETVEIVR